MTAGTNTSMQPLWLLSCLLFLSTASCFSVISRSSRHHLLPIPSRLPDTALSARPGGRRGMVKPVDRPTMNEEITYSELRVNAVSSKGKDELLGVMSKAEALAKAKELGDLDLILINEHSDPPVCKIVDYSKYRYMKEKKAKEVKKNSKASELKEVKMSYKIDKHDYEVRKKNASKFLSQGNRVKVVCTFRGREVQFDTLGFDLLDKLAGDLEKIGVQESKARKEGRNLFCIFGPRPEVMKAVSDGKRKQDKEKKKKKEEAYRERQEEEAKKEEAKKEILEAELELKESEDELLNSLKLDEDEEDDDVESSLDALLGSDDLTDDLFA